MKKQRLVKVICMGIIIFAIGICYAIWCSYSDIHIPCMFHKITALWCPGCGTTRMCMSLLQLDFEKAFYYNKAIFILIPYFVWLVSKYTWLYIVYGNSKIVKKDNIGISVAITILIGYMFIRNIVPYDYF